MAWIRMVEDREATGLLAELLEAAKQRAGKVFNILRIQSANPRVMRRSIELYIETMRGRSPVSRAQREMLAVVVSQANDCHY